MDVSIEIKNNWYGVDLVYTADNVKIEDSATEILYGKKDDGKTDFKKRLGNDITNEAMDQFKCIMEDLTYYRDREYDSTSLIEVLFEKMPEDERTKLLSRLNEEYDIWV